MICNFCNIDIPLTSWVVGEKQDRTREELRSLILHLTEEHRVTRGRGVMLVVGDLTLEEQDFMEFSLYDYFVTIGSYPDSNIFCVLCGKNIHLEK